MATFMWKHRDIPHKYVLTAEDISRGYVIWSPSWEGIWSVIPDAAVKQPKQSLEPQYYAIPLDHCDVVSVRTLQK